MTAVAAVTEENDVKEEERGGEVAGAIKQDDDGDACADRDWREDGGMDAAMKDEVRESQPAERQVLTYEGHGEATFKVELEDMVLIYP